MRRHGSSRSEHAGSARGLLVLAALLPLVLACGPIHGPSDDEDGGPWVHLEPGLALGTFALTTPDVDHAAAMDAVRVLRVDPARFDVRLLNASAPDQGQSLTAREWAQRHDLVAAINAGMYQEDMLTSVSLMRSAAHTNNSHLTRHRSILAFDALDESTPPVKVIDLECEPFEEWKDRYASMVQSIRMLSCTGDNVWEPQPQKATTAAVGTDREGRLVFVHVRVPVGTHELIDALVDLPLDLHRLMYVEGGLEAQLYVRAGGREFEFLGRPVSFPEGVQVTAWPIPNVIGVARRGED